MVQLLLHFIRATREGNWELHLSSTRSMIPWYFAYDRVNYARYLPAYWLEMCSLQKDHPAIYAEFRDGKFVAQRQRQHPFSQVACDQVIEQTVNRDSKTKGGLVGFSVNKGAVHRWILSQHERAAITKECLAMAGNEPSSGQKKHLDESRMKQDERDVKK
ncbi:hypothetical protein HOLleu_38359 [Holothuria leucospilota]|uniref:Uncharacterized protein n=1 Tax=Holothuria leucospilota TaxID=206669 RepID=A0A9Q0YEF5_HOLLE|nr:hypothetical protein HOLleu_38359 [Holothuria leucospilota]